MNEEELQILESIERENTTAVFPHACKVWLCDMVRRLDARLVAYKLRDAELRIDETREKQIIEANDVAYIKDVLGPIDEFSRKNF